MKLLSKTRSLFLRLALPVFIAAGLGMYWVLRFVADDFSDENLRQVKSEIENYVLQHNSLPTFFQTSGNRVDVEPGAALSEQYSDTMLFNTAEAEMEPYRQLKFSLLLQGQNYRISISQSQLEHEDLALTVGLLLLLLGALLLAVLLWVNRRVSQQLWQPFFATLARMRDFKLAEQTPLVLDQTPIDEFGELNSTLENLAAKVRSDFQTVKQFTENASHEMQTPLAVIQNQVELMLQNETLTAQQAHQLDGISQALRRMTRLHQALLLLTKIENNQFSGRQLLDLKPLLENKLGSLEDMILEKDLQVQVDLQPAQLEINPLLAETLLANLLNNAIKHNLENGKLRVQLAAGKLRLQNSCTPPSRPMLELHARFVRGNTRAGGLGLGLAIVQEICEKSGLAFTTHYHDGVWEAELEWAA